jgi:hypothetical protein
MIRTLEIILVIVIISGAFIATSYLTVLPSPREVSPINLRRLAFTTLQMLDSDYGLSAAAFESGNNTLDSIKWSRLQTALSASLPPNVVYKLTVYNITDKSSGIYGYMKSLSNSDTLSSTNDVSSYTVASSNVTFNFTPQKIGEANGGTLYILNCSDANGWWITGYTAQSMAEDIYNLLSTYFVRTVIVQNTSQLAQILSGTPLQGETLQNAVIINTCGEAVPIPTSYCKSPYSQNSYAYYSYFLGQRANLYNWTWTSIVGYPFYYVSNTVNFSTAQNNRGIYGMVETGGTGSIAFLKGLDNQTYSTTGDPVTDSATRAGVTFTQPATDACNYYGIYPSSSQTSTRALSNAIQTTYHLTIGFNVFNPVSNYYPGALYNHIATGSSSVTGSLLALGLARTPDIRITALSLLSYYNPRVYASEFSAKDTSRLVVLQLGLAGGS